MNILSVSLAILILSTITSSYRVRRAIGGKELDLTEWPWLASVKVFEPTYYVLKFIPIGVWHHCSATLISKQWVLTAAECVERDGEIMKANHIHIRLGDGQREKSFMERLKGKFCKYAKSLGICNYEDVEYYLHVKRVIVHEGYQFKNVKREHNVALLYLEDNVPAFPDDSAPHISRVHLHNEDNILLNSDEQFPSSNDKCKFGGWGRINEEGKPPINAHQVDMPIISEEICNMNVDHEIQICAGSESVGIRQYDLGGPLICRKDGKPYQVGIGSDWRKGKASIFTRVSAYYDWIKENIIEHEGLA
ncbi:DgyrCDS14081 [Dimorphilus gyrociliatus]|uniref:DgyrCDS14081 n=1 Tax=Dimorphilus gyrociliatus TaxID=2664684 RepID=A0A7I8WCI9_9ANNE|nr:DgyrCDS14081 [Dimorphilus gyrociliatus]